ncbi:NCK-interacting protein with SH3 domain-like isoform X2 [Bolinopsis microptera]|uniref:NCK-interacting protein with SH3 domain-like isoform X2 n=1 Tax=Bolinopsis microptera TaxID=2820187 RepID=UPI00307A36EB
MGSSTRKDAGSSLRANNSDDRIDEMSGLYSALHDFQCNQQHCLSFKKDQIVEVTKASSSANWHRGRIHGKAGFLPANGYLVKVDLDSCARVVVRQDFEGATSGQLKIYEGQVVSVIAKNDVQWWTVRSDSGKWGQVPAKFLKIMNGSTEGEVTVHTPIESPDIVISRDMPPLSRTQSHQTPLVKADISSIPRASTIDRTSGPSLMQKGKKAECVRISSSLVEGVRRNGVKYQTSKNIVQTVLERLSEEYPDWDEKLAGLCRALNQEADLQSNSVDSLKLEQLFEQLIALTEDDQQRGWSCKDDTEEISTMLTDLLGLLTNANPKVVIQVLQSVKYEPLLTLVEYYQLETRKPLKKQALQVLHESMLIQPDPICSILLTSRLPVQLASDIQANKVMSLLEQQCNVFCACLSYPNAMPRNHYDQLDEVFISYLMTAIEAEESPYDPENLIPVMFLKCVLSLNLHYTDLRNNKVCNVLKSRAHATVLSETLLVSFNRAENLTGYFPESKDGVRKIMLDLFSSPDTGELFFTNDVKVLIEVLHRNVIDRGEGDPDRVYYMQLLDRVISNTEYEDHSHYKYEILQVLQQVQDEESTDKESKSEAWKILKKHAILST